MEPPAIKDPGSFRDPSGFIINQGKRIFRSLSDDAFQIIKRLEELGLLEELEKSGDIIQTFTKVNTETIKSIHIFLPDANHIVEHPRSPIVTYPSEWTWSMLCDAALATLNLQLKLLGKKFSLKDATGYNIHFIGTHPVHIDIPSIEYLNSNIWPACGQFYRMFLFPLLLRHFIGISTKSYFLTHIQGLSTTEVYRIMGFWRSAHPLSCVDVFIPNFLQNIWGNRSMKHGAIQCSETGMDKTIIFNVKRLIKLIKKLRHHQFKRNSEWILYQKENTYEKKEIFKKHAFVEESLKGENLNRVIDLGCNIGEYSFIAANHSTHVISIDSDHECIDHLYRQAKEKDVNITPIWMDILNPTPAIGFRLRERKDFINRIRGDMVIALALLHHLVASFNLPLGEVRDFLFELTEKFLIIEFIDPEDPQFKSLIGQRNFPKEKYTEEQFRNSFLERGTLLKHQHINNHRSLFLFEKKG